MRRINGSDCAPRHRVPHRTRLGLAQRDRWQYRLEAVPRLWFRHRPGSPDLPAEDGSRDPDSSRFAEHQVAPVDFRIFGQQPAARSTMQYNETDLGFRALLLLQEPATSISSSIPRRINTSASPTPIRRSGRWRSRPSRRPQRQQCYIFNRWVRRPRPPTAPVRFRITTILVDTSVRQHTTTGNLPVSVCARRIPAGRK